mmetsp:Transcript_38569/g.44020  ORF Transcript_38569/g.44020 Transcript_38569/m.44020 type:complete len:389 (-) Transcript_38569:73-1239(-)
MSSSRSSHHLFLCLIGFFHPSIILIRNSEAFQGIPTTLYTTKTTCITSTRKIPTIIYARPKNNNGKSQYREDDSSLDPNEWIGSDETGLDTSDWEATLESQKSGTYWSDFESSNTVDGDEVISSTSSEDDAEAYLDTLAQISADENEFSAKDAERADRARQMEEWGFEASTISNVLDIATDTSREQSVEGMKEYQEEGYYEWEEEDYLDEDLNVIDSHKRVEKDPDTEEPIRTQMVYVDEHDCIGCYNCANVAENTFFMEEDHGRARVYSQWGDDDETIQIAIETCPVDCIHYIPYEELVSLETSRRDINLNVAARLVGGDARGGRQQISGNMASRCNNCPSRGCPDCPMFGVGKNPEFEKREKEREQKMQKRKIQLQRQESKKITEL